MIIISCLDKALLYSTIIFNLVFSASLVIGGIWAYFKFIWRHEDASIIVKFNKIKTIVDKTNKRTFISVEIEIINNGRREVLLYYDYKPRVLAKNDEEPDRHYKSELSSYYVGKNSIFNIIDSKTGVTTVGKKQHVGRLRIGVKTIIPYLLIISKPGIYFLEYKIDVNITRFYKGKDIEDIPIKTWSVRQFYKIKEKEIINPT